MSDLLSSAGIEWLQENLIEMLPPRLEAELRDVWAQEARLLQGHPQQAFLLLLRQYLLERPEQTLLDRLRRLIPAFARYGNSDDTVASMALLGHVLLDTAGRAPEIDVIVRQVEQEPTDGHGLSYLLQRFLAARMAMISAEYESANLLYDELLRATPFMDEAAQAAYGRMLEKLGVYALRDHAQPLTTPWRIATKHWCRAFPGTALAARLASMLKSSHVGAADMHPIIVWREIRYEGRPVAECAFNLECVVDRETDVIAALIACEYIRDADAVKAAVYLAQAYGDPYWIQAAGEFEAGESSESAHMQRTDSVGSSGRQVNATREREPSLKVSSHDTGEYRFTFFESFQGYADDIIPLFPPRYGRKKVKQLLALLLLQPHFRIVRDVLVQQLFGDDESDLPGNYMHVTIHRLRAMLNKHSTPKSDWILIQDGVVQLNESYVSSVDVQDYRKLASVGHQLWLDDREAAVELYDRAIAMYHPIVAPEFEYEDFISDLRSDLIHHQKRILRRLWDHARDQGNSEKAEYLGEALLAVDEWDLSVVRRLCEEWRRLGESRRAASLGERYVAWLERDREEIPEWLQEFTRSRRKR